MTEIPETEKELLKVADEILQALPADARPIPEHPALELGPIPTLVEGTRGRLGSRQENTEVESRWPEPGDMVNSVRVDELIGQGGMGTVWKGFDEKLERAVALKSIRDGIHSGPEARARFLREARLLSQLNHPSICQVYELMEIQNPDSRPTQYLVLEYVDGVTLDAWVQSVPAPDLKSRLVLCEQVSTALAAAHRRGIVHRDLKPDNLMVIRTTDNEIKIKILDFGIARSTGGLESASGPVSTELGKGRETLPGGVLGTPAYMSPEQARGEPVGTATDIYSLGLVLQGLLSEVAPHPKGLSTEELLQRVASGLTIPATCVHSKTQALIESMKQLDPTQRPSAAKVSSTLLRILDEPKRQQRRHRRIAVTTLFILVLTLGLGYTLNERSQGKEQLAAAQQIGAEVKELETWLRNESLLPLHDLRPKRREISERFLRLEGQLEDFRTPGPARFALGRGLLEFGNPEAALKHLTASWDSGFQRPSVAWSLGETYSELYQRAVADAASLSDPESRTVALARAEDEFRVPAVSWLERSLEGGVETESGRSLERASLAAHEGDLSRALSLTSPTGDSKAGDFERLRFRGTLHFELASRDDIAGNQEVALDSLMAADGAFSEALHIARSDFRSLLGRCRVAGNILRLQFEMGNHSESQFETALTGCEDTLTADRDNVLALEAMAALQGRRARSLEERAGDALTPAKKAVEFARRAVALSPGRAEARDSLGTALRELAASPKLSEGATPGLQLEAAAELREAVRLDPSRFHAHYSLSVLVWDLAYEEYLQGRDPIPKFEESVRGFETSIRLAPNLGASGFTMIGAASGMSGLYLLERGRNPQDWLDRSIGAFQEAIEQSPSSPWPYGNTAMAYRDLARWDLRNQRVPEEPVSLGLEFVRRAREIKGDYTETFTTEAEMLLALGEARAAQGDSPEVEIQQARLALSEALALDPSSAYAILRSGESWLVEAEWRVSLGQDPSQALDTALLWLEKAFSSHEVPAESGALLGRLYLTTARRARDSESVRDAINHGLDSIAVSITNNSTLGTSHLVRAKLLIEGVAVGWPDTERSSVEAALEQAVANDALLENEVSSLRLRLESSDGF